MKRSRSALLIILCLSAILFGLYVLWSEKPETSRSMPSVVTEVREINKNDDNAIDTMLAEIGSGDTIKELETNL